MKKIKLSIIVPCYKVEKYLTRCLDSLINQTLEDIEIICVNDGSPDNSLKILKEYQKQNKDKIIIIDKENEGVWKARLDGIKKATGEYIGFIDSDDYVKLNFAEKMYTKAKKENADICVCGFDRIDLETGKLYSREMVKSDDLIIDVKKDARKLLEINGAQWNKIYKNNILKKIPTLKNKPIVLEDMMFTQLAFLNTSKIVFVEDSLIFYMVHPNSAMNSVKKEILDVTYSSMIEVRKKYEKNNSDLLDYVDANAFLHLGISLMYRLSDDKTIDFNDALKYNTSFLNKEFPNWKNNKYIKLRYVIKNKGCNLKLWIVKVFYKFGLIKLFISMYKFMINKIHIDIKW